MTNGTSKSPGKVALDGLFWPAVAGNVLWSAMTLFVEGGPASDVTANTRVSVLLLLGTYLAVDFVLTDSDEAYPFYWFAELVHLAILTILVIGMNSQQLPFLAWWLCLWLVVNVVFNLVGAWDDDRKWKLLPETRVWKWRVAFAAASGAGLVALWWWSSRADGFQLLSAVIVTTVWYCVVAGVARAKRVRTSS